MHHQRRQYSKTVRFNIPRSPTKETISLSMASTHQVTSQFTVDQIVTCCEKTVDDTALNVVRIMDAFYLSCYASASPFLPLVSCELVKYSLQHGVCIESAVAFGSFGMFSIFFENDFATGKMMAEIVRAITKKLQSMNKTNRRNFDIRAHILLVRMCKKQACSQTKAINGNHTNPHIFTAVQQVYHY